MSGEITNLPAITRAEIDMQIATAKQYPRSLELFRQEALSMATTDREIAASCFYKLKRGQGADAKVIEGPSVRLAEIVANAWGNLRFGARTVDEGAKEVTAQGVAHDLEKNVCNTIEVSRRITTSKGARYSDDMIGVTKNAACSIALRNAIFKTVPFTYVKSIYLKCKEVAVGNAKTLIERRGEMLDAFSKMSVTKEQILAFTEKPSIEDIGLTEIEDLIGVYNAIRDGDTTIDEQFKPGTDGMPKRRSEGPGTVAASVGQGALSGAGAPAQAVEAAKTILGATPVDSAPNGEPPVSEGFVLMKATANGICKGSGTEIKIGDEIYHHPKRGNFHKGVVPRG